MADKDKLHNPGYSGGFDFQRFGQIFSPRTSEELMGVAQSPMSAAVPPGYAPGAWAYQQSNPPDPNAPSMPASAPPTAPPPPPVPQGVGYPSAHPEAPGASKAPSDPIEAAMARVVTGDPNVSAQDMEIYDRMVQMRAAQAGATGASAHTVQRSQTVLPQAYRDSLAREGQIAERAAQRTESVAGQVAEVGAQDATAAVAHADELKALAAERAKNQAEQAAYIEKFQIDRDKATAEYEKAATSIDPNRLMHGKQWMGALAMAFGAYGATLGRTQNYAQQIIDQAISRDVDAQKFAVAAKEKKLSFMQQVYQDNLAKFKSQDAALEATKADGNGIMAAYAEARAKKLKGTQDAVNIQNQADQFRLNQQARETNARQLEAQTVSESNTSQSGVASGAAGKPKTAAEVLKERAEAQLSTRKAADDTGVTTEDRSHYNKVLEQVAAFGRSLEAGKRLRTLNDSTTELGRKYPMSDDAHRHAVTQDEYEGEMLQAQSGLNVSPSERERKINALTGNSYTSHSRNVALDESLKASVNAIAANIATLPAALKADALKRVQQTKFLKPEDIKAILDMSTPATTAQQGADLGLR
jgi:hypothetical protein